MRFFIKVSFNGSPFYGWQRQKRGPSVQQHIEDALSTLLKEEISVTGAGRTDSGVHAMNYIAHFDSHSLILTTEPQKIIYKINAILPSTIVFHDICAVDSTSHARFDATKRCYQYHIHTVKDPFCNNFSFYYPYNLDIDAMNRAANYLIGKLDFTSMAKLHSNTKNNLCTLYNAAWSPSKIRADGTEASHLLFNICANRFLRNMVRAITGTLLEIGRGKEKPEWILEVLEKKERSAAGNSVPSHALFLTNIEYPYKLF